MGRRISLFLILAASLAVTLLNPTYLALVPQLQSGNTLKFWFHTLSLFSIPLCLFLLSFTKGIFIPILTALWGGWMTLSSIALLICFQKDVPNFTYYGLLFVILVLILSLAVTLFSAIFLIEFKKSKRVMLPSAITTNPPAPNP